MSKENGHKEAVKLAIEKLADVDFNKRCSRLGLPIPLNNTLSLKFLGADMILRMPDFQLFREQNEPAKPGDRILLLHYLLNDLKIYETSELISFRQLPGGIFYYEPFLARSIRPMVNRFGNDIDLLKKNLNRYNWQPIDVGDFGARIHVFGKLYVTLLYRLGDEEFPPDAELLFDASIKHVLSTEDAAVLAGRVCLGLL